MQARELNDIDSVLKKIDPALLKSYGEKQALSEPVLTMAGKYMAAKKSLDSFEKWNSIFLMTAILLWVVVFLLVVVGESTPVPEAYGAVIMTLLLLICLIGGSAMTGSALQNNVNGPKKVLLKFMAIVDSIKHPVGASISRYSEASLRDMCVSGAIKLVDAERRFAEVRVDLEQTVWQVLHAGNWEEKCREDLHNLMRAVEEFGLALKNSEIFAEAAQYFEKKKQKN